MKIATIIAHSLLGVIFVVFGSNMFLHFIPMPLPSEGPARDFMTTLFVSHYLYVVGALQVAGGLLLLTGRWLPLGLTLLGPVIGIRPLRQLTGCVSAGLKSLSATLATEIP